VLPEAVAAASASLSLGAAALGGLGVAPASSAAPAAGSTGQESEAWVGAAASPLGVASAASASRDSSPLAGAGAGEDGHACAGVATGSRSASPPQPAPAAATLHAGVVIPHRVPRASARAPELQHSGLRRALSGSLARPGRLEPDQARRGRAEGVRCTADRQLPWERSPTPDEPLAGPKREQPRAGTGEPPGTRSGAGASAGAQERASRESAAPCRRTSAPRAGRGQGRLVGAASSTLLCQSRMRSAGARMRSAG